MLAITFVFTAVFKTEIRNFAFFVLSGIFPWMFFSNALSEATFSILSQQSMLRQFNFPKEILPLSSVLSNFLNFLIGWLIIYPLFLFFNPKIFSVSLFLPICILINLFFVSGLGLLFSALNVFFRDIGQLLGVLLMLWFWITPIFYSVDMVPERFRWVCNLNPMTYFIVCYREVIFKANIPSLSAFIGIFLWAFISLTLGWCLFLRLEPKLLKQI